MLLEIGIAAGFFWLMSRGKPKRQSEASSVVPSAESSAPPVDVKTQVENAIIDAALVGGVAIGALQATATAGSAQLALTQGIVGANPVSVAFSTASGAALGAMAGREFAENVSNDWFGSPEGKTYNETASAIGGGIVGGAVGYALPTLGIAGAASAALWVLPVGAVVLGSAAIVNSIAEGNYEARRANLETLFAQSTAWERWKIAEGLTSDPRLQEWARANVGHADIPFEARAPQSWELFDDKTLPRSIVFFLPKPQLSEMEIASLVSGMGEALFNKVEFDAQDALRRAYAVSQEMGDQTLRIIVNTCPVIHPGAFDMLRFLTPAEILAREKAAAEEVARQASLRQAQLAADAAAYAAKQEAERLAAIQAAADAARRAAEEEAARLATARTVQTTSTTTAVYSERRTRTVEP